jgi:hypothetical protein
MNARRAALLQRGERLLRPPACGCVVAAVQFTAAELELDRRGRCRCLVGQGGELGQEQCLALAVAAELAFQVGAERYRCGATLVPACAGRKECRAQRVAAFARLTGGAKRERQAEQQRRPLVRSGGLGNQAKRGPQPLGGGSRRLHLDAARGLGQQADGREVTKLSLDRELGE